MTRNQPPYSLESLLETYGEDALQPCRILDDPDDSEVVTVPKMREQMSTEEWYRLPQAFRLFVLNAFYDQL